MSSDDEGFVESEYPLAIKIFQFLRWTMVACLILSVIIGVVMRTYFRNIAEDLEAEQEALGDQTF
jgi:uncharacterized membrane protein YraQ (UPF0718 family)